MFLVYYLVLHRLGRISQILLKSTTANQALDLSELQDLVQSRTKDFTNESRQLEREYEDWIDRLTKWRNQNDFLKIFSNRQIMNLIILLTSSTKDYRVKHQLFEKLYSLSKIEDEYTNTDITQLTSLSLAHYLRSLPINENESIENLIEDSLGRYRIEHNISIDASLEELDSFLQKFLPTIKKTLPEPIRDNENEQYLITLNSIHHGSEKTSSIYDDALDIDTICILLNLFSDRFPSTYQILWCSETSIDEIRLFFSRIRTFVNIIFVVMDIDKMQARLREVFLSEQDQLSKYRERHGKVYYFSRELTTYRRGLKLFLIPPTYRHIRQTYTKLNQLSQQTQRMLPDIQVVCGKEGTGNFSNLVIYCLYYQ